MRDDAQAIPVVVRQPPESGPVQRKYPAVAFNVTPDPSYTPPHGYSHLTPAPIPTPLPHLPTPLPHMPTPLPHVVDPNAAAWRQSYPQIPQTPPHGLQTYDMAGAHSRDVVVRRVVWTIALVLGLVLAIVVASRL